MSDHANGEITKSPAVTLETAEPTSSNTLMHHPVVSDLDLNFEAMELPSQPGLTMLVYTAPKDSPTADSLKLLASWEATTQQTSDLVDGQKAASRAEQPGSNGLGIRT